MRTSFFFCALLLIMSPAFVNARDSSYDHIASRFLATFPLIEEHEDHDTKQKLTVPTFHPRKLARLAFSLLKKDENNFELTPSSDITSPETWRNLELFANNFHRPDKTVLNALDRTETMTGRLVLTKVLTEPTADTSILTQRQAFLRELVTNDTLFEQVTQLVTSFATHESSLYSLTLPQDPVLQNNIKTNLFSDSLLGKAPRIRSQEKKIFDALDVLTIVSGPLIVLMSSYILSQRWGELSNRAKSIGVIFPLCMLLVSIDAHFELKRIRNMYSYVRKRLRSVHSFLANLAEAKHFTDTHDLLALHGMQTAPQKLSEKAALLQKHVSHPALLSDRYWFANMTPLFGSYPHLKEHISELIQQIHLIGLIDAYRSMALLMREHAFTPVRYSFVTYQTRDLPTIEAVAFWHPSLPVDRAVANTTSFGSTCASHNLVITGTNAGGKSTAMKALAIALILGQTFGIAPAERFSFTPFSKINTFLNITDDSSAGRSLFKAELHRAHMLVKDIKNLGPQQFSFTLLDEIFIGTEYIEGEAGAYGVARYLADLPQNMTVLATHFKGLTHLEENSQTADAPYQNMKVIAEVNEDGSLKTTEKGKFVFPFLLLPGISEQQIAVETLEQMNFHPQAISIARDVLTRPEHYTPTEQDI